MKSTFFGFLCCSTLKHLFIDALITNVGLILKNFEVMILARQHKSKFNFELFLEKKKNLIFGFPCFGNPKDLPWKIFPLIYQIPM